MGKVPVKLKYFKDMLPLTRGTAGSAGYDLRAASVEKIGWFKYKYGTGIGIQLPEGYEAEIRPRSSIHKSYMILSNSPGTIDSDYRGEICAIFYRIPFLGKPFELGDRICQMLIKKVEDVDFEVVSELDKTERGDGGFGSTGK